MEKIKVSDKIEAIVERNLEDKILKETIELKSCEECRYHDKPWIWGRHLHVCSQNSDFPNTARDPDFLFQNCPINGKLEVTKHLIKQYGFIIHEDEWYSNSYIAIVDFSPSHWESDGNNPDIEWNNIAVFYYHTDDADAKEKMMELALDYYQRLGLDGEFTKKRCYG